MRKLILYQFIYYKWKWIGLVPIFFICSLLTGVALNGLFNIMRDLGLNAGAVDPTPIFLMPIFFGGITLFFIISGIVRVIIEDLSDVYKIVSMLGANRWQLSIMIGGQIFIVSFLTSIVGSLFSHMLTKFCYFYLQGIVGSNMLPAIRIEFNIFSFLLSILIISSIAGLSGTYYAKMIFKEKENKKKSGRHWIKNCMNILLYLLWIADIYYIIFIDDFNVGIPNQLFKAELIIYLMILNIVLIKKISPQIEVFFTHIFCMASHNYGIVTGKWKVLNNIFYLKSLVFSVVTGINLLTGFQMLFHNVFNNYQYNSESEFKVSFILYLAFPIVVIITNIVSLTIITFSNEQEENQQLQILGFSKKNIVFEKLCESLIYSGIVILVSSIVNLIILLVIIFGPNNGNVDSYLILLSIFSWSIPIGVILFLLLFLTKTFYIYKSSKRIRIKA